MDEHLRANPDDVSALMRAGRLSRERVAMAAYLGNERALATGVEAWVPGNELDPRESVPPDSPAWWAVRMGALSHRGRTWIACLAVDRVIPHLGNQVRAASEAASGALSVARDWCHGRATSDDARRAADQAEGLLDQLQEWAPGDVEGVQAAASVAWCAANSPRLAGMAAADAVRAAMEFMPDSESEQAWQAHAIANTLLDPDWPPWDE